MPLHYGSLCLLRVYYTSLYLPYTSLHLTKVHVLDLESKTWSVTKDVAAVMPDDQVEAEA